MSDLELMRSIKDKFGGVISIAAQSSSVPPGFLAALIAGESGGDPNAKRFEGAVLVSLWKVLLGRTEAYGRIDKSRLALYVAGLSAVPAAAPATLPADCFQRLDDLANSWGLTQIMGYHIIAGFPLMDEAADLRDPATALNATIRMLAEFAAQFQLDVTQEFDELLRCWNTGRPDGKTFDPAYVNNGLARMAIWSSLS